MNAVDPKGHARPGLGQRQATGLDLVVLGLTLSSSWGNGHATTYRALLSAFAGRGNRVTFLERDKPWYAEHRDLVDPDWCDLRFYDSVGDLERFRGLMAGADAVMVGSYVPDGVEVARLVQKTAAGVTAFYDIDTPVTMAKLDRGDFEYLSPDLIPGFDLYLSFTGGPLLREIERRYRSPAARPLYCSVDAEAYVPETVERRWDLAYLGTYSADRQPVLERLLIEPARRLPDRRFAVAGPQYPADLDWPKNVKRLDHVPPGDHPAFYAAAAFTLNVTRADMVAAGYSPSVRLFEAAACGTPLISDRWRGLETVLVPGEEILVADSTEDVVGFLSSYSPVGRQAIAAAARRRVLAEHSSAHRAAELEQHLIAAGADRSSSAAPTGQFASRAAGERRP